MLTGITDEIARLQHTLRECRINNPHKLDLDYMEAALQHLKAYRDLHLSEWSRIATHQKDKVMEMEQNA